MQQFHMKHSTDRNPPIEAEQINLHKTITYCPFYVKKYTMHLH